VEKKIELIEVAIQEGGLLSQLVSATYLGDYFSMYLALLYNRNPSTVESIDFLKKQMETRGNTQSTLMKTLDFGDWKKEFGWGFDISEKIKRLGYGVYKTEEIQVLHQDGFKKYPKLMGKPPRKTNYRDFTYK